MKLPLRFLALRERNRPFQGAPNKGSHKMKDSPSLAAPTPSQAWCGSSSLTGNFKPGATRQDQAVLGVGSVYAHPRS